jgi:hypothetical protein
VNGRRMLRASAACEEPATWTKPQGATGGVPGVNGVGPLQGTHTHRYYIVVNNVFEVKCQNSLAPLLAACFKALVTVLNDPNVSFMHRCVGVNTTFQSVLRSCFYLAKRVFQGLGVVTDTGTGTSSRREGSVCKALQ